MPLKFSLRPGEKMIINGAVIGQGKEPGSFFVYNQAKLLRGREVMREEDADTWEKKLYLAIQLLYLFPEDEAEIMVKYGLILDELRKEAYPYKEELQEIDQLVQEKEYYRALKKAGRILG